jgi:AraC family transcriptional regulator
MSEHIPHHAEQKMITQPSLQSLFGTPLFRQGESTDEDGPAIRPLQSKPPSSIVIRLLDRAAEALDINRATAKDCIARASALLRAGSDCKRPARGGLAPWQMHQVTRHIDANLASTVRTRDCAKVTRLSTSHFSRAFKVSFGETFSQYVARRRTELAQEMMVTTDERLSQIALSCGFADQSHFTRVYHRQVGSSPASWRRQRQIHAGLSIDHDHLSVGSGRQCPQMG